MENKEYFTVKSLRAMLSDIGFNKPELDNELLVFDNGCQESFISKLLINNTNIELVTKR